MKFIVQPRLNYQLDLTNFILEFVLQMFDYETLRRK